MVEEYYWDIINATKMGRYLTNKEHEFIDIFIGNFSVKGICLDVGAGSGRQSIHLLQKGFDTVALEINKLALRKCKNKEKNIMPTLSDAQQLPFRDAIFNCVSAIEAIEYYPRLDTFLRECNRVLKERGYLMITFSNKNSYKNIIRMCVGERNRFYNLSYKKLKEKLEKRGFSVENTLGFNWLPAGRASNSKFIPLLSFLERILKLKYLPSISPWIFMVAKKHQALSNAIIQPV